jgi:tetratricopeptide (TPR) repeat protein
MLDATCAPADIPYPTDLNLLNTSREKLESIIDILYKHNTVLSKKPRTYRRVARSAYMKYILNKNPGYDKLREAIEEQLKFIKRNLKHIDNLLKIIPLNKLNTRHQNWLETIRQIYAQQLYMFENNTRTVENRIVSIGQPHVRPIKRGKANAKYEFGAKVSISLVDGYAFIDILSWDSYNEESQLIPAIKAYVKQYGYYPERVLADQIYRNKANRLFCKKYGIRLSGPRLGRPPAEEDKQLKKQQIRDSADRNAVEGKFGEGKNKYGLGRIMARIKESCETVIALAFLCMNLKRCLRTFLSFFGFLSPKRSISLYFCFLFASPCG